MLVARMLPDIIFNVTFASSGTAMVKSTEPGKVARTREDRAHLHPVRLLGHLDIDHLQQRARRRSGSDAARA